MASSPMLGLGLFLLSLILGLAVIQAGPTLLMADGKVQEQQAEACDVLKASVQNWQMGTSAHSPQPTASHMGKPNINGPGTNILPTLRRGSASSPGKGAQGM